MTRDAFSRCLDMLRNTFTDKTFDNAVMWQILSCYPDTLVMRAVSNVISNTTNYRNVNILSLIKQTMEEEHNKIIEDMKYFKLNDGKILEVDSVFRDSEGRQLINLKAKHCNDNILTPITFIVRNDSGTILSCNPSEEDDVTRTIYDDKTFDEIFLFDIRNEDN